MDIIKIHYLDNIPDGYRLLTCDEFMSHRDRCLSVMDQWTICLLTDGKCDGRGYGGKITRLTREQRESSSKSNERMGEMLCVRDDGGSELRTFAQDVSRRYDDWISSERDHSALVNTYLRSAGSAYRPHVMVTSCPGDVHGGLHSRMKSFAESQHWSFAPVQFTNQRDAADWKRLWKIQVESFACSTVTRGRDKILEVMIDGGGAGCAVERSRDMSQWWVDWIKRLGEDTCADLAGQPATGQPPYYCPPGAVHIQIGQLVASPDDFASFASPGHTLTPVPTNGVEFELHTLVLDGRRRHWVLISDMFERRGSDWTRRSAGMSAGTF